MEDLAELSRECITEATPDPYANQVNLVWRERIPLGVNLLLNDESGFVKVIEFPRGSQARKVAQEKNLDPDMLKGATIIAVDGHRFQVSLSKSMKTTLSICLSSPYADTSI